MAMARSFTESGSDEIRDVPVETCSSCAIDGKLQAATHFCFDCGVYGRCICGDCLRKHNIFVGNHAVETIAIQTGSKWKKLEKELSETKKDREEEIKELAQRLENEKLKCTSATKDNEYKQKFIQQLEHRVNEYACQEMAYKKTFEGMKAEFKRLEKEKSQIEKSWQRDVEHLQNEMREDRRKFDDQYKKLALERDDLRDRLNKLFGQKADIADLSDPNRAMKLSERFGVVYDDDWTNAFEALTDKEIGLPLKDAIAFLLKLLQRNNPFSTEDSWSFCCNLLSKQMESLRNIVLHPSQDLSKIDPRRNGGKDRPRIGSKDEKTLREVRRQICVGPSVVEEVKQVILSEIKSWSKDKADYPKKHIEACAPYIQKCAEICWLMAVHDPPLYMKMEVKPGEKFDPYIYSAYSSSGNTIDFLVWPPLLNDKDGGLLAKGVAEPLRRVGKKK